MYSVYTYKYIINKFGSILNRQQVLLAHDWLSNF